jgi:hypothetical protein
VRKVDKELWVEGPDDIMNAPAPRRKQKHTREASEDRFIGCPMWWLQRLRPVLKTADQLIVGIYVWRRWVVDGNQKTFPVPNGELQALGISRKTKYRALGLMAATGLIRVIRHSAKAALTVTILAEKPRRK